MTAKLAYAQGATLPDPIITFTPAANAPLDLATATSIELVIGDSSGETLVRRTTGWSLVNATVLTFQWATTAEITDLEPGVYPLVFRVHADSARYREFSGTIEILDTVDV